MPATFIIRTQGRFLDWVEPQDILYWLDQSIGREWFTVEKVPTTDHRVEVEYNDDAVASITVDPRFDQPPNTRWCGHRWYESYQPGEKPEIEDDRPHSHLALRTCILPPDHVGRAHEWEVPAVAVLHDPGDSYADQEAVQEAIRRPATASHNADDFAALLLAFKVYSGVHSQYGLSQEQKAMICRAINLAKED